MSSSILQNPQGSGHKGQKLYDAIKKAALEHESDAVYYAPDYMPSLPEEQRLPLLKQILEKHPVFLFTDSDKIMPFIPENERAGVILKAAADHPDYALRYAYLYHKYAPKDELEALLTRAAQADPAAALRVVDCYIDYIPEGDRREFLEKAMDSTSDAGVFYNIDEFQKHMDLSASDAFRNAIRGAVRAHPVEALEYARNYGAYFEAQEMERMLMEAARKQPTQVLHYAGHYMRYIPEEKREGIIKAATAQKPETALSSPLLYNNYISQETLIELIQKAARGNSYALLLNIEDLEGAMPKEVLRPLVKAAADDLIGNMQNINFFTGQTHRDPVFDYLDENTVNDLKYLYEARVKTLHMGQQLNDDHDLPDSKRFAPLKGYNATQLYELLTIGREEMYTSTYTGVFDRLVMKMRQEGKNVFDVATPKHEPSIAMFLGSAASHNKLAEALPFILREKWERILSNFGTQIETGNGEAAVALAEVMTAMPDAEIRQQMEAFVQKRYNEAPAGATKDAYGVLAEYYNTRAGEQRIRTLAPSLYAFSPATELSPEALKGKDGMHRQLVVFSEDEDGQASYAHFVSKYQGNSHYRVEDKGDYVKITPASSAYPMEIYANKPDKSPDAIIHAVAGDDNAARKDVEFDAVIHRGHSYNLDNTMPYFSSDNALMFLGSCGGYGNVEALLKLTPDMQPIATKERGTMKVNDPLLYFINETIRSGKPINWEEAQKFLDGLDSNDKSGYMLPHKNVAYLMGRKLNELAELREKMQEPLKQPEPGVTPLSPAVTPSSPQQPTHDFLGP